MNERLCHFRGQKYMREEHYWYDLESQVICCVLSMSEISVYYLPLSISQLSFLDAFLPPFVIYSVQFSSVFQWCATLCDSMDCSMPSFTVHQQLLEHAKTHVHQVGDIIQPSHHLHPVFFPPSIFPSTRVFSSESVLPIRWPKYWSFNFSINPSNEYSGLISFRMDLLVVQGTLRVFFNTTVQKHHLFGTQLSL